MTDSDPLFQYILVQVVRENTNIFGSSLPTRAAGRLDADSPDSWTGLPVVFDEVFTGLYRLGRFSSSSFLQVHPDISVHAKLLTGGLVPLCATVASESVYNAFIGSEKRDALLHGHSESIPRFVLLRTLLLRHVLFMLRIETLISCSKATQLMR